MARDHAHSFAAMDLDGNNSGPWFAAPRVASEPAVHNSPVAVGEELESAGSQTQSQIVAHLRRQRRSRRREREFVRPPPPPPPPPRHGALFAMSDLAGIGSYGALDLSYPSDADWEAFATASALCESWQDDFNQLAATSNSARQPHCDTQETTMHGTYVAGAGETTVDAAPGAMTHQLYSATSYGNAAPACISATSLAHDPDDTWWQLSPCVGGADADASTAQALETTALETLRDMFNTPESGVSPFDQPLRHENALNSWSNNRSGSPCVGDSPGVAFYSTDCSQGNQSHPTSIVSTPSSHGALQPLSGMSKQVRSGDAPQEGTNSDQPRAASSVRQVRPRGRRGGPMTQKQKTQAKLRKQRRSVCVRCKLNRTGCNLGDDGVTECSRCQTGLGSPHLCITYPFMKLVASGATQFHESHSINAVLRGRPWQQISLATVAGSVETLFENGFTHIRVYRGGFDSSRQWDLELKQCHELFKAEGVEPSSHCTFKQFMDGAALDGHLINLGFDCLRTNSARPELWTMMALLDDGIGLQDGVTQYRLFRGEDACHAMANIDRLGALLTMLFGRQVEYAALELLEKEVAKDPSEFPDSGLAHLVQSLHSMRLAFSKTRNGDTSSASARRELAEPLEATTLLCRTLYYVYTLKQPKVLAARTRLDPTADQPDYSAVIPPGPFSSQGFADWMGMDQERPERQERASAGLWCNGEWW